MKTYTDHDGRKWIINQTVSELSQDLHADLVKAVTLAQAAWDDRNKWANYATAFEAYFDGHTAVRPTREAYGL